MSIGSALRPVNVFNDGAQEFKGESARMTCFLGAIAIGDLVKTTLGPKGMDKILQGAGRNKQVRITNDGATILKSIALDNPAAKILVDISKTQDDEVGDGTTSVCVLAAELLREGEKLIEQKIHPQTIISGWRKAHDIAHAALTEAARNNKKDNAKFREDLMNIARTTLSSKVLSHDREFFAKMAVDAVLHIGGSTDLDRIQVIMKSGGTLADSFLDVNGFILDKKIGVGQPKRIENAKVLIANTSMDADKVKIFGARVRSDNVAAVAEIEKAEKEKMKAKVDKILSSGCNVFVNRNLIYNYPEQLFADKGIMAVEHADFAGVERLAHFLNGEIASTFDKPNDLKLGTCDVIEEILIGEDKVIRFGGISSGHACTIVLRGASDYILGEAERSLHDALCVLSQAAANDGRVVFGGGCSETIMANAIEAEAKKTPGKKALAMEAFARALMKIPLFISDNGGFDSNSLIAELRAAHNQGKATAGLDMRDGEIGDMATLGIFESAKSKLQGLSSAAEAAEMILRCDEIVQCAPRQREQGHGH